MDNADRPGSKASIKDLLDDGDTPFNVPVIQRDSWPSACAERSGQSPGICLFLTLHCPKCGQLANLDDGFSDQVCLLEERETAQFLVDGTHHEFEQ